MTNKNNNSAPFNIVFLDELLPSCFGQKSGMTFKDLLSVIGREFKNTYAQAQKAKKGKETQQVVHAMDVRKKIFEGICAELGDDEYKRFLSIFHNLEKETDYKALKSSFYIGNSQNAKNHMGANNLLEWTFSADGRIDACFIQKDDVKFIFIMDVRLSNHYGKKDTQLHELNRAIAKVISDSFDGKNGNDPQGIFKAGLIAYQDEINKVSTQFETLLSEAEQLIVSNESVQEKIVSFKNDYATCLRHVSEQEFDKYIDDRLKDGLLKPYQKELFERLHNYEYGDDTLTSELETMFACQKLIKTLGPSLLTKTIDLLEKTEEEKTKREWAKDTLNCFRIFHTMPPSHLDILEDMVKDFCSDDDLNNLKDKLEYFVSKLKTLKTEYCFSDEETPFSVFKEILNNAKNSRFIDLNNETNIQYDTKEGILADFLNIPHSDITDSRSIDKIARALIKVIVEEEYSSVGDFVRENKSLIPSSHKNSIYRKVAKPDNDFVFLFKEVLKNREVQTKLCQKYPYLVEYVDQIQKGESIVCQDELNTVCEYYREYAYTGDEEFFSEANKMLKNMSESKRALYKGYLRHVYASVEENACVLELTAGTLDVIDEIKRIETIKDKIIIPNPQEDKKITTIQPSGRLAFESIFNDFLMDMGNVDLYEELESRASRLTPSDLEELRKSGGEMTDFINDYSRYVTKRKKPAFSTLIEDVLKREDMKRRNRFEEALSNFFTSAERAQAKNELALCCLTLEPKDIEYFLAKWRVHEKENELKILFLETYQASSCDIAIKRIDVKLSKAKNEILKGFSAHYQSVVKDGKLEGLNEFCKFIQQLEQVDLEMLLFVYESQENAQACALLESILKIKSKKSKNTQKEIQDAVLCVARRLSFSKKMQNYFAKNQDEEQKETLDGHQKEEVVEEDPKEALINAIINLDKSDIDAFFSDNTKSPPFKIFFGKLRNLKNKLKSNNINEQVGELVESTRRRLNLYNTLFTFLHNEEINPEQTQVLADVCLELTPQDQKDIELEQSNLMLFPVLFSRLNALKKNGVIEREDVVNYLLNNRWEQDFYFAFDMLPREDGLIPKREDRLVFASILSSINFDQAYHLLIQKDPKKPKVLSAGLKDKCFISAYSVLMEDQTNLEAQEQLKQISCLLTLPDVIRMMDKASDEKMFSYLVRLHESLNSSFSLNQKEVLIQRAINNFVGNKEYLNMQNFRGFNLSDIRNLGRGPKE